MCDTLRFLDISDDNDGEIQWMKHGTESQRHWQHGTKLPGR